MSSTVIQWTPEKFKRFKKSYAKAVESDVQSFVFEGSEFVTGYAEYLIEYLTTALKDL